MIGKFERNRRVKDLAYYMSQDYKIEVVKDEEEDGI